MMLRTGLRWKTASAIWSATVMKHCKNVSRLQKMTTTAIRKYYLLSWHRKAIRTATGNSALAKHVYLATAICSATSNATAISCQSISDPHCKFVSWMQKNDSNCDMSIIVCSLRSGTARRKATSIEDSDLYPIQDFDSFATAILSVYCVAHTRKTSIKRPQRQLEQCPSTTRHLFETRVYWRPSVYWNQAKIPGVYRRPAFNGDQVFNRSFNIRHLLWCVLCLLYVFVNRKTAIKCV